MQVITYADAQAFLERTQQLLLQDEVTNSLMLGLAIGLRKQADTQPGSYLATVEDERGILVIALRTSPHTGIVLSSQRTEHAAALELLAEALHEQHPWPLTGVVGEARVTEDFVRIWEARTGQPPTEQLHLRLFALNRVIAPPTIPGRLRAATEHDLPTIVQWTDAFQQEALHQDDPTLARNRAETRVRSQSVYVWETPDGEVVTMAMKSRPANTVITVSIVYTPPEYRGRGYASNCVAALSQRLLDDGWKYCSLFTDLANPTSNSIYQKIGYRPVCDFNEYAFME